MTAWKGIGGSQPRNARSPPSGNNQTSARKTTNSAAQARCKVSLDMAKPPREMLSVLLRSGDGRVVPTNQREEIGMEATVEAPSAQTRKDYTSRPGAMSRFFRMSRDGCKSKYKDLKATVKGDNVPAMCLADGATQALGGLQDNDQVNMIRHQAICPDRDLLCAAELRHELEVVQAIFLTEECLSSGVSPLGDMGGMPGAITRANRAMVGN